MITRERAEARFKTRATHRRPFTPPDGDEGLVLEVTPKDAEELGEMLGDNYRLQKIVCCAFSGSRTLYADEACSIRVPLTRSAFGEKIKNRGTTK